MAAVNFIKQNKGFLYKKFVSLKVVKPEKKPLSIFMAGSPGAGKTEISRRLIRENNLKVVRIDADEIRKLIPQYTGTNSDLVQAAASRGVHILHDYVLKNNYNMLLDGTFAYADALRNIRRSLKRKRFVHIIFVYQSPIVAWRFTKAREITEGRRVPRQTFVNGLFRAMENVRRVKEEFGDRIQLHAIVKNFEKNTEEEFLDIEVIDQCIKIPYTRFALLKKL